MKKILKWAGLVLLAAFVIGQFVRPARTNPPTDPTRTIQAHTQVPADVQQILDRSCADCHSNNTRWPWYSQVAPVSWLLVDDVNEAREHFNLSEWAKYTEKGRLKRLEETCEEVEKGAMPLKKYVVLHPGSKLSDSEKQTLCNWTKAEQERIAAAAATKPPEPEKKEDDPHAGHTHKH